MRSYTVRIDSLSGIDNTIDGSISNGRDSPQDKRKSFIKKTIREEIQRQSNLSTILKELKVEGKFIKAWTDALFKDNNLTKDKIRNIIEEKIKSPQVINRAFIWGRTPQNHYFWSKIHGVVKTRLENKE